MYARDNNGTRIKRIEQIKTDFRVRIRFYLFNPFYPCPIVVLKAVLQEVYYKNFFNTASNAAGWSACTQCPASSMVTISACGNKVRMSGSSESRM